MPSPRSRPLKVGIVLLDQVIYQFPFDDETVPPHGAWLAGLRSRREPAVTGSPEELVAFLRRLAGDGIGPVQVWIEPNTVAGI